VAPASGTGSTAFSVPDQSGAGPGPTRARPTGSTNALFTKNRGLGTILNDDGTSAEKSGEAMCPSASLTGLAAA